MQHVVYGPVIGVTTSLISSVNVANTSNPVIISSRSIIQAEDSSSSAAWCVTYTDGWMEQGGYLPSSSLTSYGSRYVGFTWSFSGSPVFIQCMPVTTSNTGGGDRGLYGIMSADSTGFYYCRGWSPASSIAIQWIAKGIDPNWSAPEPTPTGDAYVEGNTLYAGDSVTNDTVNMIGGAVNNNILEL